MNKKKPIPTKPFFTRFLDQQQLQDVTGGKPNQTTKFPSDSDESGDDI
jgi:hypothetical protein